MYVPVQIFLHNTQLTLLSHENFSELLRSPCKSFKELNNEKASEFMRLVHGYIETVKTGAGTGTSSSDPAFNIGLDPNGYPVLPATADWNKMKKIDLEKLYRKYITIQYCKVKFYTAPET